MTPGEVLTGHAESAPPLDAETRARRDGTEAAALVRPDERAHPRWWRDALRRRMLAVADLLAAAVAGLAATASLSEPAVALALLPVWVLIAKLLGLYDRDHRAIRHLTIDEVPVIAGWAAGGMAALALALTLTGGDPLTAGAAARGWIVAFAAAFVLRGAARSAWRRFTPPERTAVIGDGELADAIQRKAELFHDMHLKLVERNGSPSGDPRELEELARRVDRVILSSARVDPDLIGRLAIVCRTRQVKLSVLSPLRGRALPVPQISQVADLPVFEYDTWDVSRSTLMLKRTFDVLVSAGGLILFAPLFPLIALAIRLESPGPIFFSQLRAGMNGRPFRMHKLRTMYAGAEDQLSEVVDLDDLPEPMFKLRHDPRVTRVGRFLRRLSLDELPQLTNVLRGEMSIVGPRPEQVELVERYRPEHRFRLDVRPGMTGPMQVFGRGELTFAERLAVELDYVENLSLARDLRILFQTVPAIMRGTGAY